jgi:DNA-binding CsgD family transcriptional regulator
MGAFGHSSRALIVLHDAKTSRRSMDPFIVAECFDLTPAEARVAVHISNGLNAKEIARLQSVALSTVRTQIQKVLEKAGVERQVDLMRVLMQLPVRN